MTKILEVDRCDQSSLLIQQIVVAVINKHGYCLQNQDNET